MTAAGIIVADSSGRRSMDLSLKQRLIGAAVLIALADHLRADVPVQRRRRSRTSETVNLAIPRRRTANSRIACCRSMRRTDAAERAPRSRSRASARRQWRRRRDPRRSRNRPSPCRDAQPRRNAERRHAVPTAKRRSPEGRARTRPAALRTAASSCISASTPSEECRRSGRHAEEGGLHGVCRSR